VAFEFLEHNFYLQDGVVPYSKPIGLLILFLVPAWSAFLIIFWSSEDIGLEGLSQKCEGSGFGLSDFMEQDSALFPRFFPRIVVYYHLFFDFSDFSESWSSIF